jgi:hypothetical protein
MKTSAAGEHDLKYFSFCNKTEKRSMGTIHYLILFQNSELLTVLDTQLLAVQREERQTKK